jgi:hypothetical protein
MVEEVETDESTGEVKEGYAGFGTRPKTSGP